MTRYTHLALDQLQKILYSEITELEKNIHEMKLDGEFIWECNYKSNAVLTQKMEETNRRRQDLEYYKISAENELVEQNRIGERLEAELVYLQKLNEE